MPQLANNEICTGCMACMNACAKGALSFVTDNEGFLQPIVDKEKCVECGLCERTCPEMHLQYNLHEEESDVYAGWNTIDRCVSSSGGAFSSIARYVLREGGYVYGATLDEHLVCKHIEVDCIEDLDRLRGSKYIQSSIGEVYRQAKLRLAAGHYVLFTGTPCQVAGLNNSLGKKDYPNLITIDLICHGVPSQTLFDSYIKKLQDRLSIAKNEEVINYEFRRREGWGFEPSISTTMSKCKKLYGIDALYMSAFDRAAIFRRSCYQCHYAKTNRVGDFTIGDFWGLGKQGVPFKYDTTKGVSLLLVNSDKGRSIMKKMGDNDFYVSRSLKEATVRNHNLSGVSPYYKDRDDVVQAFISDETSLDDIEKKFHLMDRSLKKTVSQLSMRLGLYDLIKKLDNLVL
jgi:coenzyme F420-reducing hydrogenase beta subunit